MTQIDLPSRSMFRGMAKLATGGVLGRAVGLLTVPILSRLYAPADYGVLSVYASLVQILFPLLCLRYAIAIPLPRREEVALALLALSALLILGLASVIGLGLLAWGPALLRFFSADVLAPWWWLIVIGLLTASLSELLGAWATRERAYGLMARNAVAIAVIGESLKLLLGLLGLRPLGLLVGQMVGQSGGVVSFTLHFRDRLGRIRSVVTPRLLRFVLLRYRGYPFYRMPSQFLLAFATQAPLLYTARLYGMEVSGQLGLALLTLALPVNLIGQAMGKAYYAEISRLGRARAGEIIRLTKEMQLRLFLVGLLPTFALMFLGPALFGIAFGSKWIEAGEYASILSLYTLLQFTSAPLMQIFNVFDKQFVFLLLNVLRAGLVTGIIFLSSTLALSPREYVFAYGLAMTAFYALTTAYVFLFARDAKTAAGR